MKPAVCDTSALIRLEKGGIITCLSQLFHEINIPKAVQREYLHKGNPALFSPPFFVVRKVSSPLHLGMGAGENEAISLAVERNISHIILDDHQAIRCAQEYGLLPLTSFHIIVAAKQVGLIPSARHVLDTMKAKGEGITPEVYTTTLIDSGEQESHPPK